MKGKNWEIGSTWYTLSPESTPTSNQFKDDNVCYLSTCRSAIKIILDTTDCIGCALVPGFTCHSVISPFKDKGLTVIPYSLNKDLTIDWKEFKNLVELHKPSILLIHGYFGFNTTNAPKGYLETLSKRGIIVIEDQTQTMFSSNRRIYSDFQVGSIRKWIPIPDGAFLNNAGIYEFAEDTELVDAKCSAMNLKQEYIINNKGCKSEFMPLFAEAEKLLDSRKSLYSMSSYSKNYLERTDIRKFSIVRRDNYMCLSSRLARHKELKVIFTEADKNTVPFLLPVYVNEGRAEFQKYMAKHNVFPTIIWKCPEEIAESISAVTKMIYDKIICFYIDQRYDRRDMERVADIVDSYFNKISNKKECREKD